MSSLSTSKGSSKNSMSRVRASKLHCAKGFLCVCFWERREERERERETLLWERNINPLPATHACAPTFRFAGWHLTHWTTPVRVVLCFPIGYNKCYYLATLYTHTLHTSNVLSHWIFTPNLYEHSHVTDKKQTQRWGNLPGNTWLNNQLNPRFQLMSDSLQVYIFSTLNMWKVPGE